MSKMRVALQCFAKEAGAGLGWIINRAFRVAGFILALYILDQFIAVDEWGTGDILLTEATLRDVMSAMAAPVFVVVMFVGILFSEK